MESLLQLYGLAVVVLPVYAFVSLRKRIRADGLSKAGALVRYSAIVLAPVFLFTAIFFVCIGLESILSRDLIAEEAARSFPLAIALGVLVFVIGAVVFAFGLLFIRSTPDDVLPGSS